VGPAGIVDRDVLFQAPFASSDNSNDQYKRDLVAQRRLNLYRTLNFFFFFDFSLLFRNATLEASNSNYAHMQIGPGICMTH